jgi:hypothetical protein
VSNQTFHKFIRALLLGSLAVTGIATAVNAEPVSSEFTIAQLRGHNTYIGEAQLNPSQYVYGRVRGAAGNIISVELEDGTTMQVKNGINHMESYGVRPGDDVILSREDDDYTFIGTAEPAWILTLQDDYGLDIAAEQSGTRDRTAYDYEQPSQMQETQPEVTPAPVEQQPEPQTTPESPSNSEPVRGQW